MSRRADAVREISQQFQSRISEIVDGVLVHLSDRNTKQILGPTLSPLASQGSLRTLVTFAIYADVLRVVRDITVVDGKISDEEVRAGLGMLSVLASGFAKIRKDYRPHDALSSTGARAFLDKYEVDTGLFGYRNDSTRWVGRQICRGVESQCRDPKPLARLNESLFAWAKAIAASDITSQAETLILQSLARVLDVTDSQQVSVDSQPAEVTISAANVTCDAIGSGETPTSPRNAGTPQAVLPEPSESSTVALSSEQALPLKDKPRKDCPYCCETIFAAAVKCKHCGEMLNKPTVQVRESSGVPLSADTPSEVGYDPTTDTFSGTTPLLMKLAIRAVQDLGWTLGSVDEDLGIVNFETGMSWGSFSGVSCTLTIQEASRGRYRVTGTGKQNVRGGQIWAPDFGGEAKSKSIRAITKMKELAGYAPPKKDTQSNRKIWACVIIAVGGLLVFGGLLALTVCSTIQDYFIRFIQLLFGAAMVYGGVKLFYGLPTVPNSPEA